ncbi:MAG TPA: hypothetical protein VMM56_14770, partial [Planctomycetaceae bacterium]|nr:hypothetical protein [Planctomycetaceae bacterium]
MYSSGSGVPGTNEIGIEGGYPGGPGSPYGAGIPQNAGPVVPSRPEDPADWDEQQLREAIEERDKKAPEGIKSFSVSNDGDSEATAKLVAYIPILLEPPRKPKPVNPQRNGSSAGYPGALGASAEAAYSAETIEDPSLMYETPGGEMYGMEGTGKQQSIDEQIAKALVESIVGSRTLIGYQTARGLLRGEVLTAQPDNLVAGWTLSALMKSFSDSPLDPAQKILLQSLTKADLLRPEPGDFDAGKLEKSSLVQHAADAISVLDGLMGLSTMELLNLKRANQNGSSPYGMAPSDPSQMYEGAEGGGADFYAGGEGAGGVPKLDVKPEIPPVPKDFPITDFNSTQSQNASRYLWSEEMLAFVNGRLGESETLMKTPELVLFAGQIPHSSTRQELKRFFVKNWELSDEWTRNPAPLITDKVFEKYMRDPGLLVTLKSLPREQPKQAQGGDSYGPEGPGGDPATTSQPRRTERERGKTTDSPEQIVAKQAWFGATEKVMLGWLDRATKGANVGESGYNLEELPFKLHKDAEPSKSFRLELRCGSGDQTEVTTLNYVRVELPSDISPNLAKRIASHYDSAMKKGEEYVILGKNGMWYDWVSTDKQTGQIVSTDVLLSSNGARKLGGGNAPQGGQPGATGGGQQLAVEILVIRVSDPSAKIPAGA